MFDHHKKSPWFAEKYDPSPEFQALRTRVRKEGWKGRLQGFLLDLESGKFDPDLNEIPQEQPPAPLKEQQHLNGEPTDANGNAGSSDDKPTAGDEDMQFNIDADEEPADESRPETNGKGPSNSKKHQQSSGDNRGEEISVPTEGNQVMIRTIPPDIGRVKLEEVGLLSVQLFTRVLFIFCSCVPRFQDSYISLWVTHCKSAISIELAGSASEMIPICQPF